MMERDINTVIAELRIICADHPKAAIDIEEQIKVLELWNPDCRMKADSLEDAELGKKLLGEIGGYGVVMAVIPKGDRAQVVVGTSVKGEHILHCADAIMERCRKITEDVMKDYPMIAIRHLMKHAPEDFMKKMSGL